MIGRIRGRLLESAPPTVVVDVQGVGYELDVPLSAWSDLPAAGEACEFFTHFVVREDAQLLYGFLRQADRDLFRLLIRVNGVGPKVALAILSHMDAAELVSCVQNDNITRLTKMPGIGKKTAERLVIDLRDKLGEWQSSAGGALFESPVLADSTNPSQEAEEALLALGYKPAEASRAIAQAWVEGMGREQLIREALKGMVKP